MKIAVDFDGTIVEHKYPEIGEEIPFATEAIKMLIRDRHQVVLWTVREGKLLDEAVQWCRERGIEFYAINRDFPEENIADKGYSRKLKVELFIDDRNIGGLPDWGDIYRMISGGNPHKWMIDRQQIYNDKENIPVKKGKKWWPF